jgi:flagellin-like hook-associated protein FlgL
MSVVINTNSAATIASNNLSASNAMLQRSLNRLSSGSKIVNASDDAGGVAVASRLGAAAKRSSVVNANIGNALSFLQNQDSTLKTMGKMLERMSELQTLHMDATKSGTASTGDLGLYADEFTKLKNAYTEMQTKQFNEKALFGHAAALNITIDEQSNAGTTGTYALSDNYSQINSANSWLITDATLATPATATDPLSAAVAIGSSGSDLTVTVGGVDHTITWTAGRSVSQTLDDINEANLGVEASVDADGVVTFTAKEAGTAGDFVLSGTLTSDWNIGAAGKTGTAGTASDNVGTAIADIATARAKNGADQSVLGFYSELNTASKTNFESAISKIMDVDVAEESTQLARWNTLVQAGTAMIAQANGSTQSALTLLR